mgnify:FL=1
MRIGNVQPKNNVFLAPMAGVTDRVFRKLCIEQGCSLVYTEMVSAKGIFYGDEKTTGLLAIDEDEMPAGLQIFGSEPDVIYKAVEKLNERRCSFIDINMGCPTPKITKNGDGAALMKNPQLAAKIMEAAVKASKKPVTVKIRKGWDSASVNAVEIARIAEDCGISAIAVHGRTRDQFYSGKADWDIIKEVKAAVRIPVIGNGDIFKAEDAINMLDYTGCDAVMVGRGAMGNPWIFSRILHLKDRGELLPEPCPKVIISMIKRHLRLVVEERGEYHGIREMRKHIAWYIKGMRNAARTRDMVVRAETVEEIHEILDRYLNDLE